MAQVNQNIYKYETNTYPQNPIIIYKSPCQTLRYKIISEGKYPPESKLLYTKKPKAYKIPNKYIVQTSYGKEKNQKMVTCLISYYGGKAKFRVVYSDKSADYVESKESPSAAANLYQKIIEQKIKKNLNKENQKKTSATKWNGVLLFGLQLQQIKDIREIKQVNR
ncbi:hypothetical protein F8M41_018429, partial [Gigaspora margarita]